MIQNLEPVAPPVPGIRKAAILMIILGDPTSSEILRQLDEDEVQAVGREVARITSISNDQAELVLEEFYQMTMARDYVLKAGIEFPKNIIMAPFRPDHSKKLLHPFLKPP